MLTPERHQIILDLLKDRGVVKLHELVEATSSSESTIRRDLSQLENEKKLKRVHGGASLLAQKGEELSITEKAAKNLKEKDKIAQYAASLIRDGDCIYLDAGTTAFQMIPHIKAKEIKVVTNGLTHLEELLERGIDTYITGGYIKQKTRALIGKGALEGVKQYRFDKCFIGVNAIHTEYGFTTPDPEEAMVKLNAMNLSQETFVLGDRTKLNEVTFAKIADLKEGTIITDETDEEILAPYIEKTTIKVVTT
ncbi:DeoR family transcriptional regulator [Anaerobacillus arseniciselenatis]|uniref:DeoR family transcriptional regulator n=1 Tax=Anaerobacillus arseniciselenatis TaxID=85682 RepID=A0A1S2LR48_9BACI|nr:DeoR/GlpR family DNA-binding transcription regulator [Anaerobacillus arseniciselenatis]OIJ13865.1 DeoR family transcriptional regulator [Anaerobacillus arseniciselenatis]